LTTPAASSQTRTSQIAPEPAAKGSGEEASSVIRPPDVPRVPPPARSTGQKAGDSLRNVANTARRIQSHIARMQPPHDGGGIGSGPPSFGGEKGGEGGGE
jgi:hypothetical protein